MPYSPISQGGRGGRGNTAFKRGLNRAPTMAELGERCEEQWLELEMKLVADVGIVGVPNAGKSTLLAALSNAKCVPPVCFLSPSIRFAARLETTRVRIDWTKSSTFHCAEGPLWGGREAHGCVCGFKKSFQCTRHKANS